MALETLAATTAVAAFLSGFFANDAFRMFCHTVAIVVGAPLLGEKTYTKLSLIMMMYSIVEELGFPHYRSPMVPALFVNSVALSASFHSSIVFDKSAFPRMAKFCGWSMQGFHIRNALVHILPSVILYAWMKRDKKGYVQAVHGAGPAIGVITASMHLVWALLTAGGLDLSELYIKFEPEIWIKMWIVAVVFHVLIGMTWTLII